MCTADSGSLGFSVTISSLLLRCFWHICFYIFRIQPKQYPDSSSAASETPQAIHLGSEGLWFNFCFGKQLLLPICLEWRMAIIARNSVTFCRSSQAGVKQVAELVPFSSVLSWVILDRPCFQLLPILPDFTVWAEMLCSEYLLHTRSFEPIWDKTFQEISCSRQGKNTFFCPRSGSCFMNSETEEMWFHFNTQAGLVTQPPCNSSHSLHGLWPPPWTIRKTHHGCPEAPAYGQTGHDKIWPLLTIFRTLTCISILFSAMNFQRACRSFIVLEFSPLLSKLVYN